MTFSVLFCCDCKWTKDNSVLTKSVLLRSKMRTQLRWCGNFTTVACRISSRLKWYKNYKNPLRLTKVIVTNKMSRFLWFTVCMENSVSGWRKQATGLCQAMVLTPSSASICVLDLLSTFFQANCRFKMACSLEWQALPLHKVPNCTVILDYNRTWSHGI